MADQARRGSPLRLVLALALAGAGALLYVGGLAAALQGSIALWDFMWSAALGAIAIQLATGPDGPLPSGALQARMARTWSVLLAAGVAVSAYPGFIQPARLESVLPWLAVSFPTLLVALFMGVWWPRYLARQEVGRLRPGYVIGGATWAAITILDEVARSHSLWARGAESVYQFPPSAQASLLAFIMLAGAALAPVLLALPVRVLLAGLSARAQEAGPPRRRRIALALMALMGSWGYVSALRFLTLQPPALGPARTAAIVMAGVVWGLTMVWVGRLWRAGGGSQ